MPGAGHFFHYHQHTAFKCASDRPSTQQLDRWLVVGYLLKSIGIGTNLMGEEAYRIYFSMEKGEREMVRRNKKHKLELLAYVRMLWGMEKCAKGPRCSYNKK